MTAAGKILEQKIQELPLEDMLAIHERLVISIHAKEESEGLEPEFVGDIQRRIEEIDSGRAVGVDAFKALEEM